MPNPDVQSLLRSREVVYYLGNTRASKAVFMAEVRRLEAERKRAPWWAEA